MTHDFRHIDLQPYNSFGVRAVADRLAAFGSEDELRELLLNGEILAGRWDVLGKGNNILFTQDYRGTLIHPTGTGIEVLSSDAQRVRIRVQAGLEWDDLVAWAVGEGLWGVENLSLIPGSVGAAPVQNIGAYGAEAGEVIDAVEMLAVESLVPITLAGAHCAFGYRDSVFKRQMKDRAIITAVIFSLGRQPKPRLGYGDLKQETEAQGDPSLKNIRRAVIDIRRRKLPDPATLGNAGSFFKNPVVPHETAERLVRQYPDMPLYPGAADSTKLAAGWLIDRAGWKGFRRGDAGVHDAQALVLVNFGGASGREILQLSDDIRADVQHKFGVPLDTEVNIW